MKNKPAALLLACLLALPAAGHHERAQPVNRAGKGWPLLPFVLQDQDGAPLTQQRLLGRWTFVLLGDTRCTQPCTDVLAALVGLRERIAHTDVLKTTQVIFVSLDPVRDTPARLRSYLARFDASFVGSTAAQPVLRQFVDDLALACDTGTTPGDRHGALVLIGPDAIVRAEYLPPYDVKLLTADYMITRARR